MATDSSARTPLRWSLNQPLAWLALVTCPALALLAVNAFTGWLKPWWVAVICVVALGACVTAAYRARQTYLDPLARLQDWALRVRGGTLGAQLTFPRASEYAELAQDINFIAGMLESLAQKTEQQLFEHTRHITQKTRSLAVLYDVAASINTSSDLDDLLRRFLRTLTDIVGARAAAVRLPNDDGHMQLVASIGLSDEATRQDRLIPADDCPCARSNSSSAFLIEPDISRCEQRAGCRFFDEQDDAHAMLVVPLQYRDRTLGVYNLFVPRENIKQSEDMEELFVSIGRHLGMAIEKARLDREAQFLSIMEERATIANELHDSLAQTLVSIGFQLRILDEVLEQKDDDATAKQLALIKRTLEDANREARTLISHFRATTSSRGLIPSVEHIVNRFRSETGIPIFLQKEWPQRELPTDHEVQVLRIVQETLNNIRKHAHANAVRVMLSGDEAGNYRVLIEDDGVGIDGAEHGESSSERFGLAILRERAARLNGELRIDSESGEGTQVLLSFCYPADSDPSAIKVELGDYATSRPGH